MSINELTKCFFCIFDLKYREHEENTFVNSVYAAPGNVCTNYSQWQF